MANTIEYKCPCCGGELEFNTHEQKMKCPFCENTFEVETLRDYDNILRTQQPDSMQWQTPANEWSDSETQGMALYHCNGCGAEIVCEDQTTGATHCPYCESPIVLSGQFSGQMKPDLVIPFKFDRQQAVDAFEKHLKGKKLLPKLFRTDNHIEEIKGVYVPFWLFDAQADANIMYRATKERSWEDARYYYRETSFYSVHRAGTLEFVAVPEDGASQMPDDLMESLEPFNVSEAVDFQTAYLSGYLANKYDVAEQDCINRANQRIKNSTENAFLGTVNGYHSVTTESSSIQLHNSKARYALYPVWILNTNWNGEKYTFAMNGQTGKFIGNLPLDKGLAVKWFGGLTGVIGAVTMAITYLISLL
ncbi:MAG: hypothetical protein IJU14_06605 [Clostridia bacterium]|nr:hypothetical protein [Clostridia bacterium]